MLRGISGEYSEEFLKEHGKNQWRNLGRYQCRSPGKKFRRNVWKCPWRNSGRKQWKNLGKSRIIREKKTGRKLMWRFRLDVWLMFRLTFSVFEPGTIVFYFPEISTDGFWHIFNIYLTLYFFICIGRNIRENPRLIYDKILEKSLK